MTKPDDSDLIGDAKTVATTADGAAATPERLTVTRRGFVATVGAGAAGVAVLSAAGRAEAATASLPVYRIHPAIGVARVGNADPDVGFILGPEVPGSRGTDGLTGNPIGTFKVGGLIKPQAARFRVWEYRTINGALTPVGEVVPQTGAARGTPFVTKITWTAHLANRKSSFHKEDGPHGETLPSDELRNLMVADRASLESDFGPRSIAGLSAGGQIFSSETAPSGYPMHRVRAADGSVLIDYLGQLRTDPSGRLLLFGGRGRSASNLSPPQPLTHWANNNYWFDDISDGPVTAVVTLDDGYGNRTDVPMDERGNAWALVAPPDFSPGLEAAVSLYDTLYDVAVRDLPIPTDNALYADGGPLARLRDLATRWDAWQAHPTAGGFEFGDFEPDYETEIWPIILNAVNFVYTTKLVNFKHSAMLSDPLGDPSTDAAKDREKFFSYVRAPQDAATNNHGPGTMPMMYGDNWYVGEENFHYDFGQYGPGNAGGGGQTQGPRSVPKYQRYSTLTRTQYGLLRAWQAGNFVGQPATPTPASTAITPHGLDRAALASCCGHPFYPGIECGWQMRNPALFVEPFRLSHAAVSQYLKSDGQPELTPLVAGHFSRQMAIPWQADFKDCSKLLNYAWWPSVRPDDVFLSVDDTLNQRVPWMRPDSTWDSGSTTPSYEDMVNNWYKFGFVLEEGHAFFIEKERNSSVP